MPNFGVHLLESGAALKYRLPSELHFEVAGKEFTPKPPVVLGSRAHEKPTRSSHAIVCQNLDINLEMECGNLFILLFFFNLFSTLV